MPHGRDVECKMRFSDAPSACKRRDVLCGLCNYTFTGAVAMDKVSRHSDRNLYTKQEDTGYMELENYSHLRIISCASLFAYTPSVERCATCHVNIITVSLYHCMDDLAVTLGLPIYRGPSLKWKSTRRMPGWITPLACLPFCRYPSHRLWSVSEM